MDFTPTDEQRAARDLAARIFGDLATHERLAAAGTGTEGELWKALCAAGLVAAVEEIGLLGLVLLLEEQGRTTAQVPFAATCVYGMLAVAAHGSEEQRARLLPAIGDGTALVTGAFPAAGTIRADASGALSGTAAVVPWLRDATHVLVAQAPDRALWLVATASAGATVEPVETTAPWAAGRLTLDGARGERLGGGGAGGAGGAAGGAGAGGADDGSCGGGRREPRRALRGLSPPRPFPNRGSAPDPGPQTPDGLDTARGRVGVVADGVDVARGRAGVVADGVDTARGRVGVVADGVDTARGWVNVAADGVDAVRGRRGVVPDGVDTARGRVDLAADGVDAARGWVDLAPDGVDVVRGRVGVVVDGTGVMADDRGVGPGAAVAGTGGAYDWVLGVSRVAFAGLQAGVCAGAVARAVAHTSQREQFGRPLAANQGVLLRAADAYMDTEAIRVTAYEAAWRHDEGLPFATHALTAAWWASEAGQRVVHAGQHLHGGAGADVEHPVHRHFLWGRQLDAYLGGGSEVLEQLGQLLTRGDPTGEPAGEGRV